MRLGVGARGPQDKKGLAPPAAEFKLNGFTFGDELVAVRTSDFRQFSLVHDGKSVAPRRLSTYAAFRLARDKRQADTPHEGAIPHVGPWCGAATPRRWGRWCAPASVSLRLLPALFS